MAVTKIYPAAIKALRTKIYMVQYKIYSALKKESGINTIPRETKFIVSLTSYPERFASIFLTLESLLNQTFKADKIILWLAKEEFEQTRLPENITRLCTRGLEVRIVSENIKSYKKLIPAIKQFSDCNIITCDDDWIYPPWFLQGLYRSHQDHPDCISAYRCRMMSKVNEHQLSAYQGWEFADDKQPSYNLFPTSGGGTLYPPGSLHDQVLSDKLFLQLAPSADDIWFKAMSLLNQTKTVMINPQSTDFYDYNTNASQTSSLWQINATANDVQLKNVFDHFKLYDQISNR